MPDNPATPTPEAGDTELKAKLEAAQKAIEEQRTANAKLQLQMEQQQARLDDMQKRRQPSSLPAVPPAPVAGETAEQQRQRLLEYANDQAREAERLRIAMEFQLKPEELEGQFTTPTEMRNAAQVKKLEKEVQSSSAELAKTNQMLQQLLDAQKKAQEAAAEAEARGELPDLGGPRAAARAQTRAKRIAELREQSAKLGKTQDSRYLTLQSIYLDPSKRLIPPTGEEEE